MVDIYMVQDDAPLSSYTLEDAEVHALCVCPVAKLLKAHKDASYSFRVKTLTARGEESIIEVSKKSFPENWDDYHRKTAILVDRYFKGEKDLLY
jgi:hypothetical protein